MSDQYHVRMPAESTPSGRHGKRRYGRRLAIAGIDELFTAQAPGELFDVAPLIEEVKREVDRIEAISRRRSRPVNFDTLKPSH
jgi:hypothetical protein